MWVEGEGKRENRVGSTSGWVSGHLVGAHLQAVGGPDAKADPAESKGRKAARRWRTFILSLLVVCGS